MLRTDGLPALTGKGDRREDTGPSNTTPAMQQPVWDDPGLVGEVRDQLAEMPGLVGPGEPEELRGLLADVAEGRRYVLQAGDCAEDPADCTAGRIERKADLIDGMAAVVRARTGVPVVRVGQIGRAHV